MLHAFLCTCQHLFVSVDRFNSVVLVANVLELLGLLKCAVATSSLGLLDGQLHLELWVLLGWLCLEAYSVGGLQG